MNSLDFIKQAFEEFVHEWGLKASDHLTVNDFSFILNKASELEKERDAEKEQEEWRNNLTEDY